MKKLYLGMILDHSGSMSGPKSRAAMADFNKQIEATRAQAKENNVDVIVSVIGSSFTH